MSVLPEQSGNEADLTRRLFDEYGRMVLVLCRALLRDGRDAEDAAQQTFLGAYRSILAGHRPSNPAAWLATIARNECRVRWAKREELPASLTIELEALHVDPAEIAAARDELAALTDALAELPERQRDVVRLHCLAGLTYGEVAETLDITSRAVDGLLVRARKRLRRRMGGIARTGVLVVPAFLRDRLAQLSPGVEEASGGAALAAGGGAGALATAGSTSLTAKLAVVGVGVAALGTTAGQAPPPHRHVAHRPPQQVRHLDPTRSGTSRVHLLTTSEVPRPERGARSGGDDERDSHGRDHRGRDSGEGSSSEPSEGGRSGSVSSGPGESDSDRSGSEHSGSGKSGSVTSGSGGSVSGHSGSESAGSDGSGSGRSGSGSGSAYSSSGEAEAEAEPEPD
jgi:RNA polymerase sigma factor (sigma-70 family)